MNGVYILSGILLVAFVGMTCIIIDIIKDSGEEVIIRRKETKPKQTVILADDDLEIDQDLFDE